MKKDNKMGTYEQIIHVTKYARYLEDKKRRETWEETVTRYMDYMSSKVDLKGTYKELHGALLRQEILVSEIILQHLTVHTPLYQVNECSVRYCTY